jgi:hypothetical protein
MVRFCSHDTKLSSYTKGGEFDWLPNHWLLKNSSSIQGLTWSIRNAQTCMLSCAVNPQNKRPQHHPIKQLYENTFVFLAGLTGQLTFERTIV